MATTLTPPGQILNGVQNGVQNGIGKVRDITRASQQAQVASQTGDAPGLIGRAGGIVDTGVNAAGKVVGTANSVMFGVPLAAGLVGAAANIAGRGLHATSALPFMMSADSRTAYKIAQRNYQKAWNATQGLAGAIPEAARQEFFNLRNIVARGAGNIDKATFDSAAAGLRNSLSPDSPVLNAIDTIGKNVNRLDNWNTKIEAGRVSGALRNSGNWLYKAAHAVNAPSRFISEATFEDMGNRLPTRVSGAIGSVAQGTFNGIGGGAEWVIQKTGLRAANLWWHEGRAASALANAQTALGGLANSAIPAEAVPHLNTLQGVIAKGPSALNAEEYNGAYSALKGVLSGNLVKAADAEKTVLTQMSGQLEKMHGAVENAVSHSAQSRLWQDAQGVFSRIPGRMSKSTLFHTTLQTSLLVGTGIQAYGVAHSFTQKIESLRQMTADMTGQNIKDVSTYKILFSNDVPKTVADARYHVFKEHGLRGTIQAVAIALSLRGLMKNGNVPLSSFIAPQLANAGVDFAMGESVAKYYTPINEAYKKAGSLGADNYSTLILSASKELANHRSAEAFAAAAAEQYVAEHTSPAQVLKEIDNGKFSARLKAIAAAADAAREARAAQHAPQLNVVAQPVVGPHTARLDQERAVMANNGPSMAG